MTERSIRKKPVDTKETTAMVSMLTSNGIDKRFESYSGQTKDYKIGICCFPTKHAELMSLSKDWLARTPNGVTYLTTGYCSVSYHQM
jgi:hypothetical protein